MRDSIGGFMPDRAIMSPMMMKSRGNVTSAALIF
jgi:hypothetical protein